MSGRSATVRKVQQLKDTPTSPRSKKFVDHLITDEAGGHKPGLLRKSQLPYDDSDGVDGPLSSPDSSTIRSNPLSDPDSAYARVRRPDISNIESNIEKSALRVALDSQSDNIRQALGGLFGGKKKAKEMQSPPRPATSNTFRPDAQELEASEAETTQPQNSGPVLFGVAAQFGVPVQRQPPSVFLPTPPPKDSSLKRWPGGPNAGARYPQPWDAQRRDDELWLDDGDTLIYLTQESPTGPVGEPSYRVKSKILRQSKSIVLVTLLEENKRRRESMMLLMPPTPAGSPEQGSARLVPGYHYNPAPLLSDKDYKDLQGVRHTISLPPPQNLTAEENGKYNRGTRNALALLHRRSVIGINFFEVLKGLEERLFEWLSQIELARQLIINYLGEMSYLDVRYAVNAAPGLLAWSEQENIRWDGGYREAFVHCCGMYNSIAGVPELEHVKPASKALIERYAFEMQSRVQQCEQRLATFDYDDMWSIGRGETSNALEAFERCRTFLRRFYKSFYGAWPPKINVGEETWLTRTQTQELQKDFSALYDYLVDRDVRFFNEMSTIIHSSDPSFSADTDGIPTTVMLAEFDKENRYPHIPHPFPVLPESIPAIKPLGKESPAVNEESSSGKKDKKKDKKDKKKKSKEADTQPAAPEPVLDAAKARERKLAENKFKMAYTAATNLLILRDAYEGNRLVEAFVKFEQSDMLTEVNPNVARRGRWILIYGVLQTLATISVDTPELHYHDGCNYFLNPMLEGCPPWRKRTESFHAAHQVHSHCWVVPKSWAKEPDNGLRESQTQNTTYSSSDYDRSTRHSSSSYGRPSIHTPPATHNDLARLDNSARFQFQELVVQPLQKMSPVDLLGAKFDGQGLEDRQAAIRGYEQQFGQYENKPLPEPRRSRPAPINVQIDDWDARHGPSPP